MTTRGRRGDVRGFLGRLAAPPVPRRIYVHLGSYGCRYSERDALGAGAIAPARTPSPSRRVEVVEAVDPSGIREVGGDHVLDAIRSAGEGPRLAGVCLVGGAALVALGIIAGLCSWPIAATLGLALGIGALLLWPWADRRDRTARRVELHYVLDGVGEQVCEGLATLLEHLRATDSLWSVRTRQEHGDWKRNAGATVAVDRAGARVDFAAPPDIVANVHVGRLALGPGRGTLYFFPDRLILLRGGEARSVPYPSLAFENRQVRFVEEDRVPPDAEVVGHTWRFVNKDGSPDRRFNDNRRLPIAAYGEVEVSSDAGLRFALQTSSAHVAAATPRVFSVIAAAIRRTEHAAPGVPLPPPPPGVISTEAGPAFPGAGLAALLASARARVAPVLSFAWAERLPEWVVPILWGLACGGPVAAVVAWAFSGRPASWAAPLAMAASASILLVASLVAAQVRTSARARRERRQSELEDRRAAFRRVLTAELKATPIGRFDFAGLVSRAAVESSEADVVADELYAKVAERVMADGVVTGEERGKLDSLARVLRIGTGRAGRIEFLAKEDRYRQAVTIAAEDGIFTEAEVRDLDELRCSLGLDPASAALPAVGEIEVDQGGMVVTDGGAADATDRRPSRTRPLAALVAACLMIAPYPAFRSLSAPPRVEDLAAKSATPSAQGTPQIVRDAPPEVRDEPAAGAPADIQSPDPVAGEAEMHRVARVIDGDTVEVIVDGKPVKIRLIGVDTPETVHPSKPVERFGREASAFAKARLEGKSVALEYEPGSKLDKYGRTLAYLRDPDGLDINREIIARGFGHAYTRFPFSRMEDYRAAEREAREKGLGLWGPDGGPAEVAAGDRPDAAEDATPAPAEGPAEEAAKSVVVYVTNTGAKYHRAGCQYLAKSSIATTLAAAAGKYGPCSKCHPPIASGEQLAGRTEGTAPAPSSPPAATSGSAGTTPRGFQLQVGPRGGVYHYSKNGKKVYQKKK